MGLLGWIFWGLVFGAAVLTIAYTVSEVITKTHLPEIILAALHQNNTDKAKKLLADVIQATVTEVGNNCVTVEVLAAMGNQDEKAEITITGLGVDSTVQKQQVIYAY